MKLKSKYKHFYSQKCIWICRLRNGGHFVQGNELHYILNTMAVDDLMMQEAGSSAAMVWTYFVHVILQSEGLFFSFNMHNVALETRGTFREWRSVWCSHNHFRCSQVMATSGSGRLLLFLGEHAAEVRHTSTSRCRCILGAVSIRKTVLPGMAIPMLKIRRPNGRLIFNMEIAIRR